MARRKNSQHKKIRGKNPANSPANDDDVKATPASSDKPGPKSAKEGFKYIREPDRIVDPATNQTVLIEAILAQDVNKVANLLDAGASPNKATRDGRSPLHHAVSVGSEEIAVMLMEFGCQLNPRDKERKTPLFEALKQESTHKMISFLLEAGCDADITDADGQLPLHVAAGNATVPVIRALLEYTDNANRPDNKGYQPLHRAAEKNTVESVQALLFERVAIFSSNNEGDTALHLAANRTDSTAVADYLLKTEGSGLVNAVNINGRTPLHIAVLRRHEKLAVRMIDKGANVNLPDKQGATPLHDAAEADSLKLAKILIESGADVAKCDSQQRTTPLILSIRSGSKRMMALLLESGADPSKADSDGVTPLMAASFKANDEAVGTLLGAGADCAARDRQGRNVLQHVSAALKLDTLKKLMDGGAELDGRDSWKRTPLLSAIMDHNMALAKELLDRGVNVNAVDDQGNSPLHLALSRRKLEIIDKLIEKGVDTEVKERWSQQTALHVACQSGLESEVAKLVKAGAKVNAKDQSGRTPLHLAVLNSYSSAAMVRSLLAGGADPLAEDNQRYTPYDMAHGLDKRPATEAIKQHLQKKGLNPTPKRYNGYGGYYGGGM
jgi:ankyrin repeat protein